MYSLNSITLNSLYFIFCQFSITSELYNHQIWHKKTPCISARCLTTKPLLRCYIIFTEVPFYINACPGLKFNGKLIIIHSNLFNHFSYKLFIILINFFFLSVKKNSHFSNTIFHTLSFCFINLSGYILKK